MAILGHCSIHYAAGPTRSDPNHRRHVIDVIRRKMNPGNLNGKPLYFGTNEDSLALSPPGFPAQVQQRDAPGQGRWPAA
jgi:hypothetical protein